MCLAQPLQDLFNEKRLPQVVRCLFSLSEVVKTTIPEYHGPYLSAQEKPEVHPAVKAVVDIAKGNIPAPGWERTISGEPNFLASAGRPSPLSLIMPLQKHVSNMGSGCLSPAAHAAGQLTYGVYEGGGTGGVGAYVLDTPPTPYRDRPDRPDCKIRPKDSVCNKIKDGGVGAVEQGTEEALAAQREVHDRLADAEGCGAGSPGDGSIGPLNVEYGAGSTLPVMNTPRVWPSITPRLIPQSSSVSSSRYPPLTRMLSASTPKHTRSVDGENSCKGTMTREEEARRRREATARTDSELEVALWIEGVTGVTFPGKFWSSLKDGGEMTSSVCIPAVLTKETLILLCQDGMRSCHITSGIRAIPGILEDGFDPQIKSAPQPCRGSPHAEARRHVFFMCLVVHILSSVMHKCTLFFRCECGLVRESETRHTALFTGREHLL